MFQPSKLLTKRKGKDAIIVDFILSIEIVIIALGSVVIPAASNANPRSR
jgi:predicted DNA repair protein MutK